MGFHRFVSDPDPDQYFVLVLSETVLVLVLEKTQIKEPIDTIDPTDRYGSGRTVRVRVPRS